MMAFVQDARQKQNASNNPSSKYLQVYLAPAENSEKDNQFAWHKNVLKAVELTGNGLGAFRDGMLRQLTRQDQSY